MQNLTENKTREYTACKKSARTSMQFGEMEYNLITTSDS